MCSDSCLQPCLIPLLSLDVAVKAVLALLLCSRLDASDEGRFLLFSSGEDEDGFLSALPC